MNRRKAFIGTIGCLLATFARNCVALAEKTRFYWPGRYSEKALRSHLANRSDKHKFSKSRLDKLTFQDCIDVHDYHHTNYLRGNAPHRQGKQIGKKWGRGPTNIPTGRVGDWIKGKWPEAPKPAPKPKPKPKAPPAPPKSEPSSRPPAPAPEPIKAVEPKPAPPAPKPNPPGWQTTPKSQSGKRSESSGFRNLWRSLFGKS